MLTIDFKSKVEPLLASNMTFVGEINNTGLFGEKRMVFQFDYQDDKVYPFDLRIEIGRNWSDDNDPTPIVQLNFSMMGSRNGHLVGFDNTILDCEMRKEILRAFYFRFEEMILEVLNSKGGFGYKRDSLQSLFYDYKWFKHQKAFTPSGRFEVMPDLTFGTSELWEDEKAYINQTLLADVADAKRYIRYFLHHNSCNPEVVEFLLYALNSNKPVRIIKERSFWNYSFLVRPDMLYADSKDASSLGYFAQCDNHDKEEVIGVMKHNFDMFSEHSVVSLCLDGASLEQLRKEDELFEENPFLAIEFLVEKMEQLKVKDTSYDRYDEQYRLFLDGLLDLYAKYETLFQQLNEVKYKRRAEKAKRLWLRYTN